MRSQTHTTARRPVIQYGKRGAARRSSSIRYPDDEDEDDIVTEKVATVKATAPSHHSRNGSGTSASVVKPASIDSPHRNSNKAPRRSVVEVVILSPSSKRSSLPRSKGKQKIVEDTKGAGPTSILKKRKSRVELLASEGDDSATGSVESEDPLILSPSKRTRPTHSYARYGRVSTPDDNVDTEEDAVEPPPPSPTTPTSAKRKQRMVPVVEIETPKSLRVSSPAKKKQKTIESPVHSPDRGKKPRSRVLPNTVSPAKVDSRTESSEDLAPAPAPPRVKAKEQSFRFDVSKASPGKQGPGGSPRSGISENKGSGIRKRMAPRVPVARESSSASPSPAAASSSKNKGVRSPSSDVTMSVTPRKAPAGLAKRMLPRTMSAANVDLDMRSSAAPSPAGESTTRPSSPFHPFGASTPQKPLSRTFSTSLASPSKTPSRPSVAGPSHSALSITNSFHDQENGLAASASPSRPAARTYGKSRSFLVELSSSVLEPRATGDQLGTSGPQDMEVRESYSDLRARWGVDMSEEAAEGSGIAPSDLRTVTELRTKGETRKFLDEVGYLFEGLDPSMSLAVRRLSATDVVSKMADPEFLRKARITDIINRAWDLLREAGGGSGDPILDMALAAFSALVAQDSRALIDLSGKDDFDSVLDGLLRRERELEPFSLYDGGGDGSQEDARRAGVGKAEKKLLRSMHDVLTKSNLWQGEEPYQFTGSQLASLALNALPPRKLKLEHLRSVLVSLIGELSATKLLVESYASGSHSTLPMSGLNAPNLQHVGHCVKIIERCLYGQAEDDTRAVLDEYRGGLATGLVALAVYTEIAVAKNGKLSEIVETCFSGAFKLLITLCEHEDWCTAVMQSRLTLPWILRTAVCPLPISTTSSESRAGLDTLSSDGMTEFDDPPATSRGTRYGGNQPSNLDTMCFALALLTNILQHHNQSAELVGNTVMSSSCPRRQGCLIKCKCVSRESALQKLVSIYDEQTKRSDDMDPAAAEAHFLRGHLAVMLGILSVDQGNRQQLLEILPGPTPGARIDALTATMRDFVSVLADATSKMEKLLVQQPPGDGNDTQLEDDAFPEHVNTVDSSPPMASSFQGSQRDHETVNAVITQLEELRSSL